MRARHEDQARCLRAGHEVGGGLAWDHAGVRWRSDRSARARWAVAGVWAPAPLCVGATLAGAVLASSDGYALNVGGQSLGSMSVTMGLSLPGLAAAILALRGTALRGLNDRVEAIGGRLEVMSPPGDGPSCGR